MNSSNFRLPTVHGCRRERRALSIVLAGLLLAPVGLQVQAQVSSVLLAAAGTALPGDSVLLQRDHMQGWSPAETMPGVNNMDGLQLKESLATDSLAFAYPRTSPPAVTLNAGTGALLWSYANGDLFPFHGLSSSVANGVVNLHPASRLVASTLGTSPADLFLRVSASPSPFINGQLLTYTFTVWNLGPGAANQEVLTTSVQYPFGFDYVRISGTPGLGTCTHPPYQQGGMVVCHENSSMAPNTTWTVRLTVQVLPNLRIIRGSTFTQSGTVTEDSPDPNLTNNTATVTFTVAR